MRFRLPWPRERRFPSFAAARQEAGGSYERDLLNRFRVERARLNVPTLEPGNLSPSFAVALEALRGCRSQRPTVVDLGGACGEWGWLLRQRSGRDLDYVVVESPDLARRLAADPFFDWFRCVTEVPAELDVFLSSGTLQYLEDPYGAVETAFARARELVVLVRNSFAPRESFRVQRSRLGDNGAGARLPPGFDPDTPITYPHRTVRKDRVLDLAARAGWRVVLRRPTAAPSGRGADHDEDLVFAPAQPPDGPPAGAAQPPSGSR
jgi:putative methyltransferase (TIGR04325 family)